MLKKMIFLILLAHYFYCLTANGQNELNTWEPPAETQGNSTFTVQARKAGDIGWTDLYEYNVKVGHQSGLINNSSMVNFDFSGTIDIQITYNGGNISSYDIRPISYKVNAIKSNNTLTFSITQDNTAPRKMVVRINNNWETEVLHILTNLPEKDAPSVSGSNVLAIDPGDPIPYKLPAGKDTYYFKPGLHNLPKGLWVEVDLGASHSINKIGLNQGSYRTNIGQVKYVIETKVYPHDSYSIAYDGTGNTSAGNITQTFTATNARFVRLKLLGNNAVSSFVFASVINEFSVFATGGTSNLALNKAIAGGMPGYEKAVDGDPNSSYMSPTGNGNWHAGESFFLEKDGITVFIPSGAIVKGSFLSDACSNVTIKGRGILDCSDLRHTLTYPQSEGRTGAVWLVSGSDNKLEGITILDPPMWSVVMNFSTRPVIEGINLIGSAVNADGIHLSGSNNGLVDGVFIRTPDDNFVMYHYAAATGNTFRNSVLWGDDAHIVLLGLAGSGGAQPINNITFQNLDILNQQGVYDLDKFNGCFKLWPNGGNLISDIIFNNIRIDTFRNASNSSVFQFRTDERFPGEGTGAIKDVIISNLRYRGSDERKSLMKGVDSSHGVMGVNFVDYNRQDIVVTDESSGNINVQPFVSNIRYSHSTTSELKNLSLNKPANSDQPMYSGHGADKAVDGTVTGYAQASSRIKPWMLTIDLDSSKTFNRIVFKSGASEYASDFTIEVSNNSSNWTTLVTEVGSSGLTKTYNSFGNVTYRYVRLNPTACVLSTGDWGYTVLDFEIYNDSVPGPTSSLSREDDRIRILIFPNPVIDKLNIVTPASGDNLNYRLTTSLGNLLQEGRIGPEKDVLNMMGFSPGLYVLCLTTKRNKKITQKIIKLHE